MIRPTTFAEMGLATQVADLLSVGTPAQVMTYLQSNYEFIFRDIVPKLRKFKSRIVSDTDRIYKKSSTKLGKITSKAPVWTTGMDAVEFSHAVRNYLLKVPSLMVYSELHRLQEHVDVKIVDPSKSAPKQLKYTVGEVFEFLNNGVRGPNSQLLNSNPDENPLWAPFRYDFQDGELANKIDLIWKEYNLSKIIENYEHAFVLYDTIPESDRDKRLRAVLALLDFYRRILVMSMNPGTMKKLSRNPKTGEFDQIGPMEAYKFANMDQIMNKFTRRVTRTQAGIVKAMELDKP